MTILTNLRKLAEAAQREEKVPPSNLAVYDFRVARDNLRSALSPDRVLVMLDVIEAAKAYRDSPNAPTEEAFDAALAKLEQEDGR